MNLNDKISEITGAEMVENPELSMGNMHLSNDIIIELIEHQVSEFDNNNKLLKFTLDRFIPKGGINKGLKWLYADQRFLTFKEYQRYVKLPIDKNDLIASNKIPHDLRQESKDYPDEMLEHYFSLMKKKAPKMANFFFWG